MKKLLSVLLTLAMAFSVTAMPVQAAGTVVDLSTEDGAVVQKIEPQLMKTPEDADKVKSYAIGVVNDEEKSVTIPISIQKDGKLNYVIAGANSSASGNATYILSSDEEGSNVVAQSEASLSSSTPVSKWAAVKKGTYYITIKVTGTLAEDGLFSFEGCLYPSGNQVLTNKKMTFVSPTSKSAATYLKVTTTKPSKLTFQYVGTEDATAKITLCDKNKKAISIATTIGRTTSDAYETYVVGKGTYYYKIVSSNNALLVQSTANSYTDPAGKTSSKAKALKVNKETKGYVSISDKKGTVDYYKCTTTKAGQLKGLYVALDGQGSVTLTIKAPGVKAKTVTVKGGSVYHIDGYYETTTSNGSTYYRDKSFPKGTYTISIKKNTAGTNGTCYIGTKLYKNS